MRPHHAADILRIRLNFHDGAIIQLQDKIPIWFSPKICTIRLRGINARIHRSRFDGECDGGGECRQLYG